MTYQEAAVALAWHSLESDTVWEVAHAELEARNLAVTASSYNANQIMFDHNNWARSWLDQHITVIPVGQWIQKQVDELPVNQSQFAGEAGVASLSPFKYGVIKNITIEHVRILAIASINIRNGKSAFLKNQKL